VTRVDPAPSAAAPPGREPASGPDGVASTAAPGRSHRARRVTITLVGLAAALVIAALVSAATGQLPIPVAQIVASLATHLNDALAGVGAPDWLRLPVATAPPTQLVDATLWAIRLPRVVLAIGVGAALSIGGLVMQGTFRNPLAEPGVVGVSSGAALAASAAIVFGIDGLGIFTAPALAFAGGLATTLLVYVTARSGGRTEVVTLVLTGIAINAVAGAGIALMTFLATTQQREQIVFWQLGSLNGSRWQDVLVVLPIAAVGVVGAALLARRLDLLALGERQARHLGVDVERTRIVAIVVVAVLTAAAVALCGIISFVGLVVPHLMRMLLGPAHRALVPSCALGGAVLLLVADTVARTAVPYADLPIGMLTAIVGGPFFFWLLRRARRRSGGWA
jgi:iron complex transport system permease protein